MERIHHEELWLNCVSQDRVLFENSILPELLGKFFSRPPEAKIPSVTLESVNEVYCYCRGPEAGDMVGCDHKGCPYKWFHLSCLKFPKSKVWYRPDCRKLAINDKSKNAFVVV